MIVAYGCFFCALTIFLVYMDRQGLQAEWHSRQLHFLSLHPARHAPLQVVWRDCLQQ